MSVSTLTTAVILYLYNNTPSNANVYAASNSYRPLIKANVFAVLFMNELKNVTNAVIGKLGKLIYNQNCSHDFETKEVSCIGYTVFGFCICGKRNPLYPIPVASFVSIVLFLICISIRRLENYSICYSQLKFIWYFELWVNFKVF